MSKYIYLTAIQIFLNSLLFSQTGPGGVGSSVNNVIWLDVSRETKFVNNNPVDTLTDWSGNGNNFYYVNDVNQRPLYRTQLLHDKPVIRFDGNNDRLRSPSISALNNRANVSWFIVCRTENASSTRIVIRSNYASNNSQWGTYHNTTNFVSHTRDSAGVAKSLTRAVTTTGFHIFSGIVDSVNKKISGSFDGFSLGNVSGANGVPTTHNSTWLGCNSTGGTYFWLGSIAEVIAYNTNLNTAEQKIIENYLAAKYNISISNDLYAYDSLLGFGNDLIGIGRDSSSHEITTARGTGILSISSDELQNGHYALTGHNNASLFIHNNLTQIDSIQSRLERTWRIDKTSFQGSIDLTFHLEAGISFANGDEYVLLIDTIDGKFTNESIFKISPESFDTNTFELVFQEVNIPDGAYFTLAKYGSKNVYNGPAGVGNFYNNLFWLDASSQTQYSNNQSVDTLFDISGNAFHFTNTSNYPIYKTNQINGKPTLDFTNQFLRSQAIERMGAGGRTWFIVASADNNTHTGVVLGNHYTGNSVNNYGTYINAGTNVYRSSVRNAIGTFQLVNHGWATSYQLLSSNYSAISQSLEAFRNGYPTDTVTSLTTTSAHIKSVIGREPSTAVNYFDGKIAEVILYNVSLNKTQRILVENYLSSKYNLSIANDKYGFEATHAQNLAGIGKINNLDYHLRATGKGMVELSSESLDDETFVLFAHNTGSLSLDSSDIPSDIYGARVTRTWRADISGNGAMGPPKPECNITYNLQSALFDSTNQYILLVDTIDSQFGNGGTVIYNGVYNEADSTVLFGNVILKDSCYFTIASRGAYLVTWVNLVNTEVIEEYTLEKTSGGDTSYNAGATSSYILPSGKDGWVEYTVSQLAHRRIFGLSLFPNINESDTTINYATELLANDTILISEMGIRNATGNKVALGDKLRIERKADSLYYKLNDIIISRIHVNTQEEILLDASLYNSAAKFAKVLLSKEFKDIIQLYPNLAYAIPKKEVNAGIRYCGNYTNHKLKFKFVNKYHGLSTNLQYRIYNYQGDVNSLPNLSLNSGVNLYSVDLLPLQLTIGAYYMLEITDPKGEKTYLKFKYN